MTEPAPEPITGGHRVTAGARCALDVTMACPPEGSEVAKRSWVLTVIGSVVATVAVGFATGGALVYAQSTDAAKDVAADLAEVKKDSGEAIRLVKSDLQAQGQAVQRTELRAQRTEVMLEQVVIRLGMTPPPPLPRDGGL